MMPLQRTTTRSTQPLEHIDTKMPDLGVSEPQSSQRARAKPQQLVPLSGSKSYESSAAVNIQHSVHPEEHEDQNCILVAHCVMKQCSMKAGMKNFKEGGKKAAFKELCQLHFQDTFEPIHPKDLTPEERQEALESHAFCKEKQDQTVQGRVVAGGNKQRGKIDRLDASCPTAALESVLLTAVIDAHEGCDVAVFDIPNASVQTCLKKEDKDKVAMHLRGKLAKLMVKVAPETCTKHVVVNRKGGTCHASDISMLCVAS
jgi:hypothetical protein